MPQGVGYRQITEFLEHVPGIGENKVRQQLENLKAGGHYTRIMQEVSDQVALKKKPPNRQGLSSRLSGWLS